MRKKYTIEQAIAGQLARARKRGEPYTLTVEEWRETLEYFNNSCAYCGRAWDIIEHYIPLGYGFGTSVDNCLPACSSCNIKKDSKNGQNIRLYTKERVLTFLQDKGVKINVHNHKFEHSPGKFPGEVVVKCISCNYGETIFGIDGDIEGAISRNLRPSKVIRIK